MGEHSWQVQALKPLSERKRLRVGWMDGCVGLWMYGVFQEGDQSRVEQAGMLIDGTRVDPNLRSEATRGGVCAEAAPVRGRSGGTGIPP